MNAPSQVLQNQEGPVRINGVRRVTEEYEEVKRSFSFNYLDHIVVYTYPPTFVGSIAVP